MNTYARSSKGLCATAVVRLFAVSLTALVMFCLASATAFAQCTLNGVANPCLLIGPVTITTTYDAPNNTVTTASGTITNNGVATFTSAANNTVLNLGGSTTLQGGGTVTLAETGGGNVFVQATAGGVVLTNVDNLIQGAGIFGNSSGLALVNDGAGVISANSSGQTLFMNLTGGITNQGLMKATNSGILEFDGNTITNTGANLTADGGTVQFNNATVNGGTLNSLNGGSMQTIANGFATLNSVTISSGSTYTSGNNTEVLVSGTLTNNGVIQITSGANNAIMGLNATTLLTGGGTLTMTEASTGGVFIEQTAGGITLENVNNLIQGAGIIGNGGLAFQNDAAGTVNANVSGQTLFMNGSGNVINLGVMKATNGGTLEFDSDSVANTGTSISANGGTVQFNNATVNGGTLNSLNGGTLQTIANGVAILNSVTLSTGSTYSSGNNTELFVSGTFTNKGALQLTSGANNTIFALNSSVLLAGGGTVTMTETGGGGVFIQQAMGGLTLENVSSLIQGAGVIGNGGIAFQNDVGGTVNANVSGQTLFMNGSGNVTNLGVMKATNGGTLEFDSDTVANAGTSITANGGTVQLNNATINGGTLTSVHGGTLQTIANGVATLNGVTLSSGSTYSTGNNTDLFVSGTFTNNGALQLTSGANNTIFGLNTSVLLTGGGTVTMAETGGGGVFIQQTVGGLTLENVNNLIQGAGTIGNGGLFFQNDAGGTVNANASGLTVLLDGSGNVTNLGLLEATGGGTLEIASTTVNNQGGNISGLGGTVLVSSGTLQGGTLNGTFQTVANGVATLDGATHGTITLSSGTTYATGNNTDLFTTGTINNNGDIQLTSGANNTFLELNNNTTLTGNGTVTLAESGAGSVFVSQTAGGLTLDNFSNTIRGAGVIGNGGLTVINEVGGTILANVSGQTLFINTSGSITNLGTFQVNPGATMLVQNGPFTNFAGNTLTGGTYNVFGPSTLEIDQLGSTGGEIVNNAATILLDSPGSNLVDAASKDALSNFSNNTSAGSFTIQSGRNFTSPSTFTNAGVVNVGTGSTFTTGGSGNYNQSGGSTKVDGALTAGGGHVNINGGTLLGNGGTITGNVSMSGTLSPGDTPGAAGALGIAGNYAQLAAGIFQLDLGGLTAGSQFDLLNVTGTTSLNGTLDISLINAFFPTAGDTFTFITSGGLVSGIFATVNGLNIGSGEMLQVVYNANNVQISTISLSPVNDFWNGGTGVWSNGAQWSLGTSPGINNNAIIYSGGNDLVTLNIGSGSVNQLNVGGALNGFTSELTDGGTAQNLTIVQGLSVGANGFLDLTGASTVTAATMGNSGHVFVGTGATVNLTSQPLGITDAVAGSQFDLLGTFTAGSGNGFANLNSIEGAVNLFGQNFTDTPGSGTLTVSNTGSLAANSGTTLKVAGNVDNSGSVTTDPGGNTLTITGTVTNSGTFQLNGPGDKATMAGLTNNTGGFVDVEGGSTFQVNGNASNSGQIFTSFKGTGGNTFNVTGSLTNTNMIGLESTDTATIGGAVTNSGSFQLTGGAMATFSSTLMNTGTVDLENGSTLKINGTADNFGTLSTSANSGTGGNTLTVSGVLTNEATGTLSVNGPSDVLKASAGLVNQGLVTVKNGSTIDPPFVNNLGTINIDGTSTFVVGTGTATGPGFIQLANGTFGEMINSATAFGQVNVAGSASLNGTLDILLQSGFNPAVGTSFTFLLLNPGQLSGTYATILNDIFNGGTEKWVVNYNDAGGFVSLTAASNNSPVPEPGTFLLLGSGLLSIAYGVRRRRLK
jgi:PEP-CTERM motif